MGALCACTKEFWLHREGHGEPLKVFKLEIQFSPQKRKSRRVSRLKALRLMVVGKVGGTLDDELKWWQRRQRRIPSQEITLRLWVGFDYLYGKGGTESSAQDISKLSNWVDRGGVTWHWKQKRNVGEGNRSLMGNLSRTCLHKQRCS